MGWRDLFFGKSKSPVAATSPADEPGGVIITPDRQFINKAALGVVRKGMWAVVDGKVGVLTGLTDQDGVVVEVTIAKPDGTTMMVIGDDDKAAPARIYAPLSSVRRAHIEEIPESRRGSLDKLYSFGYQNRSEA